MVTCLDDSTCAQQMLNLNENPVLWMEPRKNFAILESSRELLKPWLPHLRKQPEPRKKIEVFSAAAAHPPTPTSPNQEKYPH